MAKTANEVLLYREAIIKNIREGSFDFGLTPLDRRHLSEEAGAAETVYWAPNLYEASQKGKEVFIGTEVPLSLYPSKSQVWIPDSNWPSDFNPKEADPDFTEESDLKTILRLVEVHPLGLRCYDFGINFSKVGKATYEFFYFKAHLGLGYTVLSHEAEVVAALAFLQQRIVSLERMPVPRGDRRRAEKEGKPEPTVRVVTLRKREQKANDNTPAEARDWSCQWLVGAHWRKNHWDVNKPIFVDNYLKGPEDKPFKPPKAVVYQVKR